VQHLSIIALASGFVIHFLGIPATQSMLRGSAQKRAADAFGGLELNDGKEPRDGRPRNRGALADTPKPFAPVGLHASVQRKKAQPTSVNYAEDGFCYTE